MGKLGSLVTLEIGVGHLDLELTVLNIVDLLIWHIIDLDIARVVSLYDARVWLHHIAEGLGGPDLEYNILQLRSVVNLQLRDVFPLVE